MFDHGILSAKTFHQEFWQQHPVFQLAHSVATSQGYSKHKWLVVCEEEKAGSGLQDAPSLE